MINGKLIKVCGMRVADNIAEVESLGVDFRITSYNVCYTKLLRGNGTLAHN